MKHFCVNQPSFLRKAISLFVMSAFLFQLTFHPASAVRAEFLPNLPAPGTMVSLTDRFEPPMLLGMALNAQNPLLFEFLVDRGQEQPGPAEFSNTSDKLVKYFLSAMTVPDAEAWVNLSPYENDRIMPDQLSATEMGKTMLEQDYILKQLSASLTNPDKELGKKFWDAVKKKALERFGTTELPMSTLNKVWIVPQKALVLEKDRFVLIGESRLKVMLEQDYSVLVSGQKQPTEHEDKIATLSSEVFRDMIVPELEKEVNEGTTFAPVRQIYHAVILATWYKKNLRESLLGKVYIDKNKIVGVDTAEKGLREKVYDQYLSAFQKGVYNLIKDEVDIASKEALPRKYFSGGTSFSEVASSTVAEDMARPSTNGRRALNRVRETMDKGRVLSVDVQLADSPGLGDLLRNKVVASSTIENSRKYYFGEKSNVGRGIHVLEDAYKLSNFLGPRNEKGPGTILLVGAGLGVSALQMALRYPNFTIWAVNKEKGLWNIAQAIGRVGQFEKDRYSDRQIVEALKRIKVVESLDIEDSGSRQQMLRIAPNTFDAVIIETNVSLYLTDQIRVFEELFNERLKADGFFAFEVAFPSAFQAGESTASEELALASIERAFVGVGDIQLQGKNVTASYTVERKQPQQITIPLEKDWLRSEMVGGQSSGEPRVFQSRYTVRSSSAVAVSDDVKKGIFLAGAQNTASLSDAELSRLYYWANDNLKNRGVAALDQAYELTSFLDQRIVEAPAKILLVGAGYGVAALQLAFKYPGLEIWAVNREQGLWNTEEAMKEVRKVERKKYSSAQVDEALKRIRVVESLDIEDSDARATKLPNIKNGFDAVVIETGVTLYFKDQIKAFEALFNEQLKADGIFAFEFTSPRAAISANAIFSESLALGTTEEAFSRVGSIKSRKQNFEISYYVVERNKADNVSIPLAKNLAKSGEYGGNEYTPKVVVSRYILSSSSAVTEQEVQRAVVFYALLIFGPSSPQVLTSQIVMNSIPDEERRGMTEEIVGGHLRSLLGEPNAQGQWDRSGAVWRDLLGVEVMKAMMALDYETIKNIFLVMPERTAEQESALLSLRQNLLSRQPNAQIPDPQILLALKESQLTDFLANPQALAFARTVINARLTILFSPKISNDMVPVEITINRSKKAVNVSKGIAGDGAPSQQLTDEVVRLMTNLKDLRNITEVENIVDDPNAEVVIYGRTTRTVIVPRYVSLRLVNNKLEDREMEIMLSSSGIVDGNAPITSDAGIALKKGGIDFNPALFDLQIKRDGKGVPLPLPQQDLQNINVEGFYPVIINIQPATLQSFPVLLSALEAQSPV